MKQLLCKIGIHKWFPRIKNLQDEVRGVFIFRTYLVCTRCDKHGKLLFYKALDEKKK